MANRKRKRRRTYNRKRNRSGLFVKGFFGLVACGFALFLSLAFIANRSDSIQDPIGLSRHREEAFIEEMSEEALKLQEEYGIRPSVTIAQAILESNWGESGLAQNEQNYFGIKGASGTPEYATREYTDEWIEVEANFRSYDTWEDSMEDYAKLLANGTAWDETLYHPVIEAETYAEAAEALQEAGYATDPTYADKIIDLIERYDLNEFDEKIDEIEENEE